MWPQILVTFALVIYGDAVTTPYGYAPAAPVVQPAVVAAPVEKPAVIVEKPQPYSFAYDIKDEEGNTRWRKESGDEYGTKQGTYGYVDVTGLRREVQYIAGADGFRAWINTNEPGTKASNPADVQITVGEAPALQPAVQQPEPQPPTHRYPYGLPYMHPAVVVQTPPAAAPQVAYSPQ